MANSFFGRRGKESPIVNSSLSFSHAIKTYIRTRLIVNRCPSIIEEPPKSQPLFQQYPQRIVRVSLQASAMHQEPGGPSTSKCHNSMPTSINSIVINNPHIPVQIDSALWSAEYLSADRRASRLPSVDAASRPWIVSSAGTTLSDVANGAVTHQHARPQALHRVDKA